MVYIGRSPVRLRSSSREKQRENKMKTPKTNDKVTNQAETLTIEDAFALGLTAAENGFCPFELAEYPTQVATCPELRDAYDAGLESAE